jgi:hypothetical protein
MKKIILVFLLSGSIGTVLTISSCSDYTGSSASCFDGIQNGD